MSAIERAWREGGALAASLRPLGALYRAIAAGRAFGYRAGWFATVESPLPVVVVGNLSVGGTGKTPLTAHLVEAFRRRGWRPGVVSRGYGGARHETPRHVRGDDASDEVGDEPLMLHRATGAPVCVCVRRADAVAALARDTDCDLVLSDDGLQHLAMARDAEIVVVDGTDGFGNGRSLPAGPLREPPSRLASVDLVAVRVGAHDASTWAWNDTSGDVTDGETGGGIDGAVNEIAGTDERGGGRRAVTSLALDDVPGLDGRGVGTLPPAFRFALVAPRVSRWPDGERHPLSTFAGRRVHAVAGIARPERFFATLRDHGLVPDVTALPDHHPIAAGDLAFDDADPVLVTRKDAVRLDHVSPLPTALHVVDLDVAVDASADALLDALSARLWTAASARATGAARVDTVPSSPAGSAADDRVRQGHDDGDSR